MQMLKLFCLLTSSLLYTFFPTEEPQLSEHNLSVKGLKVNIIYKIYFANIDCIYFDVCLTLAMFVE